MSVRFFTDELEKIAIDLTLACNSPAISSVPSASSVHVPEEEAWENAITRFDPVVDGRASVWFVVPV